MAVLPAECVLMILSSLPQKDLYSCVKVCRLWSACALPLLYACPVIGEWNIDKFMLRMPKSDTTELMDYHWKRIRGLNLGALAHDKYDEDVWTLLRQSVNVLATYVGPAIVSKSLDIELMLTSFLSNCCVLQVLDLSMTRFRVQLHKLLYALHRLSTLKELSLPPKCEIRSVDDYYTIMRGRCTINKDDPFYLAEYIQPGGERPGRQAVCQGLIMDLPPNLETIRISGEIGWLSMIYFLPSHCPERMPPLEASWPQWPIFEPTFSRLSMRDVIRTRGSHICSLSLSHCSDEGLLYYLQDVLETLRLQLLYLRIGPKVADNRMGRWADPASRDEQRRRKHPETAPLSSFYAPTSHELGTGDSSFARDLSPLPNLLTLSISHIHLFTDLMMKESRHILPSWLNKSPHLLIPKTSSDGHLDFFPEQWILNLPSLQSLDLLENYRKAEFYTKRHKYFSDPDLVIQCIHNALVKYKTLPNLRSLRIEYRLASYWGLVSLVNVDHEHHYDYLARQRPHSNLIYPCRTADLIYEIRDILRKRSYQTTGTGQGSYTDKRPRGVSYFLFEELKGSSRRERAGGRFENH